MSWNQLVNFRTVWLIVKTFGVHHFVVKMSHYYTVSIAVACLYAKLALVQKNYIIRSWCLFSAAGTNCCFFDKSYVSWQLFIFRQWSHFITLDNGHFNLSIWCHSIGISFGQLRSVLSSVTGSVHKLCNAILVIFYTPSPSVTPFALALSNLWIIPIELTQY